MIADIQSVSRARQPKTNPGAGALLSAPVRMGGARRTAAYIAWVRIRNYGRYELFATRAAGTSMTRAGIEDGARLFSRFARTAESGDIVIVNCWLRRDMPIVKHLVITASGQRWLTSAGDGPGHGAWRMSRYDQILGVVESVKNPGEEWLWRVEK